ncbi:hypothetical protein EDC04DRAFT_3088740 [Pisolithus marmoratus]|nr:hypothetical protein EDC04DRAFT_3088740 [Pisolithus marmoratus]
MTILGPVSRWGLPGHQTGGGWKWRERAMVLVVWKENLKGIREKQKEEERQFAATPILDAVRERFTFGSSIHHHANGRNRTVYTLRKYYDLVDSVNLIRPKVTSHILRVEVITGWFRTTALQGGTYKYGDDQGAKNRTLWSAQIDSGYPPTQYCLSMLYWDWDLGAALIYIDQCRPGDWPEGMMAA